MNKEEQLDILLKAKMGYTDKTRSCLDCTFHNEAEMGIHLCEFNTVHNFRINSNATCKYWEREPDNKEEGPFDDIDDPESIDKSVDIPIVDLSKHVNPNHLNS